jgi:putative membrane protein
MTRNPLLAAGLAAAFALAATPALAQNADKASQSFIKTAIQHNYAEIDAGKLAAEKGKSAEVKQFGERMVKDHSEANQKAIAAAKQMGIDPPTRADITHQTGYLKLKTLSGNTFDKSFAKDMLADHQKDVKEFQKESSKSDPAGQFAKDTVPTLEEHLRMAQQLNQTLNGTTGSGSRNKQ